MRASSAHFPANNDLRSPFVFWIFAASPRYKFITARTNAFRSKVSILCWMPFRNKVWSQGDDRIFKCSLSARTIWAAIFFNSSRANSLLPFMPFLAPPPKVFAVVGPDLIRRDVSAFGGMPLRREQRMRFGERHKRLLPARGYPGLIHGPHATAAAPPLPTKLVAPLQSSYFVERFPRISIRTISCYLFHPAAVYQQNG